MRRKTLREKFLAKGKSVIELQRILHKCEKDYEDLKSRVLPNDWREHTYYTSVALASYRKWKKGLFLKLRKAEEASE
jgi:hypothetical protein